MSNPFIDNKWQICWQIINSALAAGLVILGAFTSGIINMQTFGMACIAGLVVFFTQFRAYWQGEQGEYGKQGKINLLTFI